MAGLENKKLRATPTYPDCYRDQTLARSAGSLPFGEGWGGVNCNTYTQVYWHKYFFYRACCRPKKALQAQLKIGSPERATIREGETLKEDKNPNAVWDSPYKFNGKEQDEETGLYYYGARYYIPQISVWLSVDPLTFLYPSHNPYNFVMGNPIMLIDPTGLGVEPAGDEPEGDRHGFFKGIIRSVASWFKPTENNEDWYQNKDGSRAKVELAEMTVYGSKTPENKNNSSNYKINYMERADEWARNQGEMIGRFIADLNPLVNLFEYPISYLTSGNCSNNDPVK